jgi:acetyl esterase
MSLDPTIKAFLDQVAAAGSPALQDSTVEEARTGFHLMVLLDGEPEAVADVSDRTVPGPAGPVPVRIYRPAGAGDGPLPVLTWFHGGGFVIGDLQTGDPTARKLANRTGALVVSVDYRLAPEHRFPAAADDSFAVVEWLAANAAELGGDPTRIAVGGDSAGGNMAAVSAQRAVGAGIDLRAQALVYPVIDLRMGTPSYVENAEGLLLTAAGMAWFIAHYLGDDGRADDPRGTPLLAASVAGVAPATIVTAQFDPLRDEGIAYAERLGAQGVKVHHLHYDDMLHGFATLATLTPRTNEMLGAVADDLRDLLS